METTEQKLRKALTGALATLESLRKPGVLAGRDASIADHYPDDFALGRVREALALPETPAPRIVIVMDGGLVQNVLADTLVEVVKVDYDTEGCGENDGVVELQDVALDGSLLDGEHDDAFINNIGADLCPGYVATRFKQCEEHAESDDDGCPKDDPECLGDNGDCHDACITPTAH